jgi:ribA/ribD-fused uncharacterized protein
MSCYNLRWLQEKFDKGEQIDYLFFWGHTNKYNETIGKFIFSQWYPSSFEVDGVIYKTAEHWMMAEKARLFSDFATAEKIIRAETPKLAKELGRQLKGFEPEVWEKSCYQVVVTGNRHKFSQNDSFKDYLLSTGDKVIVEASPVDAIWGIGLAQDSQQAKDPYFWRGQNLLGFALMEVRDMLRE